jgi:hypothetical protein
MALVCGVALTELLPGTIDRNDHTFGINYTDIRCQSIHNGDG